MNIVADNSTKRASKIKLRIKPYGFTATNSKKDGKKTVDQNFRVSKVKLSEFATTNVKKYVSNNDGLIEQKFEASKRKLEQRYRQLAEGQRKTEVIDFMEIKDLTKTTRDVKRPRFRR